VNRLAWCGEVVMRWRMKARFALEVLRSSQRVVFACSACLAYYLACKEGVEREVCRASFAFRRRVVVLVGLDRAMCMSSACWVGRI
jgi:hypothetical protein